MHLVVLVLILFESIRAVLQNSNETKMADPRWRIIWQL